MPLVSVLLAARDAERYVTAAARSILRQTLRDLELVVVDDGSEDGTGEALARIQDRRLVVLRNERPLGLAASLNRALERASGRFLARLDADDIALPSRLERQLARAEDGRLAVLGSAVLDIDSKGRPGALREMPLDPLSVRWHALFSSPFYHSTVLIDRAVLDGHSLRYDPSYLESEDYDLWARLLELGEGANLGEPLVLYRVHEGQASRQRRRLQRTFQREIALRQIARLAPQLGEEGADLAWRVGAGEEVSETEVNAAVSVYLELLRAFRRRHGAEGMHGVVASASRVLWRLGARHRALALAPTLPVDILRRRARRAVRRRLLLRRAAALITSWRPPRVVVVAPEPTPYRAPVFDLLACRPEVDLTVIYSAHTLMWRTWKIELGHPALFLYGPRLPGGRRLFHHDYALTPGIFSALSRARPDLVVIVGWSTFAAQAAHVWCRARSVPYVLEVDSHAEGPRPTWRRAVRNAVLPAFLRGAAAILVPGTLARRAVALYGVREERVHRFALTVDVERLASRCDALRSRRASLREAVGLGPEDVAVLSVARLSSEKRLDVLIRAASEAGDERIAVVVAGEGRERPRLLELARELGVRLLLLGQRPWQSLVETYATADVFALLSEREPWGVVVNEAAACALPLVLSDRVGAAHDLLREGENGRMVPAGDVEAAAAALRELAADPALRRRWGARSREIVSAWRYEESVESFLAACREALGLGADVQ